MAFEAVKKKYIPEENSFYRNYYHYFFYVMALLVFALLAMAGVVIHILNNRPEPVFYAKDPDNKTMLLTGTSQPNLLPDTIIRFASKAAVLAYTYDFAHYEAQLAAVKPYFTKSGWDAFNSKLANQIQDVRTKRLFVNGVVVGTPVINNQGELPDRGYVWRVVIPFLITFQSASETSKSNYTIEVSVVHVPTTDNPQGIGIDQFITG